MDHVSLKSRIKKRIDGLFPNLAPDEILVESYGEEGGVRVSLLRKMTKGRSKQLATATSRNRVLEVNGLVGNLVEQIRGLGSLEANKRYE